MRGGCARVQGAEFVLRCACFFRACIRLGDTPQGWREAHGMCEGYLTDGNPEELTGAIQEVMTPD